MSIKKSLLGRMFVSLRKRNKATMLVAAVVVLFLLNFAPAHALETGIGFGTLTGLGTQDIRVTIMQIIRAILGFVGLLALILVLYAGFLWMTSGGNEEKITTAKALLRNALIGLIIIFSAFSIASFIIAMLTGALGNGGTGTPPGGEVGVCENCAQLGSGIIETVYPSPNSRDIPRNTSILVTFKVPIKPSTVIDSCSTLPCSGNLAQSGIGPLAKPNVRIYDNTQGEGSEYAANAVIASTSDGKTYRFQPTSYLGNGSASLWYAVKLTGDVQKDNGQTAFQGTANYFLWRFEIGTVLDLDPVEVSTVFPIPDNSGDQYSIAEPKQASGQITLVHVPKTATVASVSAVTGIPNTPTGTITGTYNCGSDATISVTVASNNAVTITPAITGLSTSAPISNGAIILGCGLTLQTASAPTVGNQWSFTVTAQKAADTLRIANRTYTFVAANPTGNQILIGADLRTAIINKINADNLSVTATPGAAGINALNLKAKIAGEAGNNTIALASGSWATITPFSGGANGGLQPTAVDVIDQPRNAIISFDFTEPVDPQQINKNTVVVEYEDTPGHWTAVDGAFAGSNQYRSWNFIPTTVCTDDQGKPLVNSCSEKMYCLPTVDPSSPPYVATHYRVTLKAGGLKTCSAATDCADPDFNTCAPIVAGSSVSVCQISSGANAGVAAPGTAATPNGITDEANNSFNGNRDSYTLGSLVLGRAIGPQTQNGQTPYSLNTSNTVTGRGDDLTWSFYINKNVKLDAPQIGTVGPTVAASGANLATPVEGQFNTLLMSSTLKPGNNYKDGQCGCSAANPTCPNAQTCDTTTNRCVADSGDQPYCLEDSECPANSMCVNKKYVTLIDRATIPVGWWVTNQGFDVATPATPKDGYADQTDVQLQHTRFLEVTNYGTELGSGIKDIYQNCFLPSNGPGVTQGSTCNATAAQPYCCNGVAMSRTSWEGSSCFTNY